MRSSKLLVDSANDDSKVGAPTLRALWQSGTKLGADTVETVLALLSTSFRQMLSSISRQTESQMQTLS